MRHIQYLHLIPTQYRLRLAPRRRGVGVGRWAASKGTADPSLRLLQWLVAGLAFLALFLISFRANGWM